ncbi:MAG: hypothetical protein ACLR4Z_10840 [Butyricicoccaceae bacterium]
MAEVKLRALVLREVDFGDWDRYLTVLAEERPQGGNPLQERAARQKTNPAARQLCFSEFILAREEREYALREADLVHSFFVLAEDTERYALACYPARTDLGAERPGA